MLSSESKQFVLGLVAGVILAGSAAGVLFYLGRASVQRSVIAQLDRNLGAPDFPSDTAWTDDIWDWHMRSLDGAEVRLADFKGKVVFLHFWATWCTPCVRELPGIQRLADSLARSGVVFLLVSDEKERAVQEYLAYHPARLAMYTPSDPIPGAFQPRLIPSTYIFDRSGRVRMHQSGDALWGEPNTVRFLRKLL
jgi:thiol-disulfide isomerase/thioredoxin